MTFLKDRLSNEQLRQRGLDKIICKHDHGLKDDDDELVDWYETSWVIDESREIFLILLGSERSDSSPVLSWIFSVEEQDSLLFLTYDKESNFDKDSNTKNIFWSFDSSDIKPVRGKSKREVLDHLKEALVAFGDDSPSPDSRLVTTVTCKFW